MRDKVMSERRAWDILLVKDQPTPDNVLKTITDLGNRPAFRVTCVDTLRSALSAISARRYDVVLADVYRNRIDGLQLCQLLPALEDSPPVIALTGRDRKADLLVMRAGAADFLPREGLSVEALESSIRYAAQYHAGVRRLRSMSMRDPATSLATAQAFRRFVAFAVHRAKRGARSMAVMVVDISALAGHPIEHGQDYLQAQLREAAERLLAAVRRSDRVARIGPARFGICIESLNGSNAYHESARVAEKVLDRLDSGRRTGPRRRADVGIGIATFPETANNSEELICCAGQASAATTRAGSDRFRFFVPEMHRRAVDRANRIEGLRRAISSNQLLLYAQPQVTLAHGRIVAVEALARWNGTYGACQPRSFVPMAEECGLITSLDRWVRSTATAFYRDWRTRRLLDADARLAVNVSLRELQDGDLIDELRQTADELQGGWLEVEIKEGAFLEDPEACTELCRELQDERVSVAIDDFAAGYDSIAQLARCHVDTLKISRVWMKNLDKDPDAERIITAAIGLSRSLDCTAVAQGVETERQRRFLLDRECDRAQGYLFGRPVPCKELFSADESSQEACA